MPEARPTGDRRYRLQSHYTPEPIAVQRGGQWGKPLLAEGAVGDGPVRSARLRGMRDPLLAACFLLLAAAGLGKDGGGYDLTWSTVGGGAAPSAAVEPTRWAGQRPPGRRTAGRVRLHPGRELQPGQRRLLAQLRAADQRPSDLLGGRQRQAITADGATPTSVQARACRPSQPAATS